VHTVLADSSELELSAQDRVHLRFALWTVNPGRRRSLSPVLSVLPDGQEFLRLALRPLIWIRRLTTLDELTDGTAAGAADHYLTTERSAAGAEAFEYGPTGFKVGKLRFSKLRTASGPARVVSMHYRQQLHLLAHSSARQAN